MFAWPLSVLGYVLCILPPRGSNNHLRSPERYLRQTPAVSGARAVWRHVSSVVRPATPGRAKWALAFKVWNSETVAPVSDLKTFAFLKACLFLFACLNYVRWFHNKYYASILSLSCFYLQTITAVALLMKQPILKECLPQRHLSLKWLHFVFQT